ncbi:MAG TPA: PAS domain S-box protein, partial [Polyangiaceae bacterium]|nr:PAS domain S-box protein [Polyangiaceae bacterium]
MFRPLFDYLVWRRDPSRVAIPSFAWIARELLATGMDANALFAGTGLEARGLEDHGPVSFEAFLRLLGNARRLGGERALVDLGARLVTTGRVGPLSGTTSRAFGAADAYFGFGLAARIGARFLFPALEVRAWEVAPRKFTFELSCAHGAPPEEVSDVVRGVLAALPERFGFERVPVVVEAACESTLFHVELGEPVSVFTSLRWMPRRVRTMRIAVEELKAAHALLEEQYEELRRTQSTLRESEARFRALIENSSDFILLVDARGVVTYVSPSAERITGRPASEATHVLHLDLVHEDDRDIARSAFERILHEPEQTVTMRVRFRAEPDGWIWVEGTARNMLGDPSVAAILVNYRDITDRMRLEEQLLQARKLESIGRLAGGLAHDFNNLLMGVLGNAELALLRAEAGVPVREQLEQIMEYSRRGADLTSQLLSFARKKVVQPRLVNLNDLVRNTLGLLERLIGTHVEIVTKLAPELDPVEIDPSQLQQVLVNLATNARDAMPNGGILTITTGHVSLTAQGRAWGALREYVALVVSDTGTGMDEDTRGRIFEPFFTTKEVG